MKKVWLGMVTVIITIGMVGSLSYAGSLASSVPSTENAQTTLTVVFGPNPEFDPVAGASADLEIERMASDAALVGVDDDAGAPEVVGGPMPSTPEEIVPVHAPSSPVVGGGSGPVAAAGNVPEPSTLILLGLGVLGLLGMVRRKYVK